MGANTGTGYGAGAGGANYGQGAGGYDNNSSYNNAGPGAFSQGAGHPGTTGGSTAGPHNSSLLNKLDPRVDSDMDGARNAGLAQTGPGGAMNQNTHTGGMGGMGSGNRY